MQNQPNKSPNSLVPPSSGLPPRPRIVLVKDILYDTQYSDYPTASFGQRALALIVDSIFSVLITKFIVSAINAVATDKLPSEIAVVSLQLSLWVCYYIFPLYATGQTLAKKLFGVKIVSMDGDLSFGQLVKRETFGRFCSMIILGGGYLMSLFRPDKQTLHDIIAKTRAVNIKGH